LGSNETLLLFATRPSIWPPMARRGRGALYRIQGLVITTICDSVCRRPLTGAPNRNTRVGVGNRRKSWKAQRFTNGWPRVVAASTLTRRSAAQAIRTSQFIEQRKAEVPLGGPHQILDAIVRRACEELGLHLSDLPGPKFGLTELTVDVL
jgi:hypothetical protein